MGVLVFAESDEKGFKKSSFEAISYGKDIANSLGQNCVALCINTDSGVDLGKYGADKTVQINNPQFANFNAKVYAQAIAQVAETESCQTVIFSQTYSGKSLAPLVAVKMNAGLVTGVVSIPDTSNGFKVQKTCFSGKAISTVSLNSQNKVISIFPNSYRINASENTAELVEGIADTSLAANSEIVNTEKVSGKIALTEAELVVSGGRGLKGAENWHLIEDLASALSAGTACSKPVSDMEWRPHSEHVGQTGITIKPNLYIAVGISGAIQHLAGVGSSKVICVINTDPEAPFFKAADYGIVGDAFEVLPKLTKRVKEIKGIA